MTHAVSVFVQGEVILGEGPCWDDATGRLYWVDMLSSTLHFWSAKGGAQRSALPIAASALGVRRRGGLIVVGGRVGGIWDVDRNAFEQRVSFDAERPNNRSNDGCVGADGRFWFGTMDGKVAPGCGALYSIDKGWNVTRHAENLSIPNAIRTTADAKNLFCADTTAQTISVYDLDAKSGVLSARRVFSDMQGRPGGPDGAALDEEGYLWVAIWRGGRVIRFAPDGSIDREIILPVSQTTSCAFGGPDHRTLFITSARMALDAEALAAQPLAGSVFALDAGVRGVEVTQFSD